MKMIVCLGPRLSGKSKWAIDYVKKNPNFIRMSFRDMWKTMRGGEILRESNISFLHRMIVNSLYVLDQNNLDVVIDDYILDNLLLKEVLNTASEVTVRWFDVSIKDSMIRNAKGDFNINPSKIKSYYENYSKFIKNGSEFNKMVASMMTMKPVYFELDSAGPINLSTFLV